MRHAWKFAIVAGVALVVANFITVSHSSYTCVLCRSYRFDWKCLGVVIPSYAETDCSRWYAAHVEPSHAHLWERGTCVSETNLLGRPLRMGCSSGRFPIWRLDPDTQLAVYQHFEKPIEAKAIFANLTDEKTHEDRLEEDFRSKGDLIVKAMTEWKEEGFPGPWNEFWERFYTKHVAEHQEWLTWLRSDSNMCFWDWKEKQKRKSR